MKWIAAAIIVAAIILGSTALVISARHDEPCKGFECY